MAKTFCAAVSDSFVKLKQPAEFGAPQRCDFLNLTVRLKQG